MNNTKIKSPYQTLNETLPYNYGNSLINTLSTRSLYLANLSTPNKDLFNRQVAAWKKNNRKAVIQAYKGGYTDRVIVNLPFQKMLLSKAIEKKYITISSNNEISIPYRTVNTVDSNFLTKELFIDLVSTVSWSLTSTLLNFLYTNRNTYMSLQCAALVGIAKGIAKLASSNYSLKDTPWNCIVEIWAETTTDFFSIMTGRSLSPLTLNAFKGFTKYNFEQIVGGNSALMSSTTLSLEVFKSAIKGASKTHLAAALVSQIFLGHLLGASIGSILSVAFVNILIDQCTV